MFKVEASTRNNLSTLEKLKKEELELTMQVAEILGGDDQILLVKAIEEDTELLELRMKAFQDSIENFEMEKSKYSRQAFKILSNRVDEVLKEMDEK